jgi:hypothetical protein
MSDTSRIPFSKIQIFVGSWDYAQKYVVFAQTTFQAIAGAQPGTCEVTLKDPNNELSFTEGSEIRCVIDGVAMWGGFLMQIERGFFFSDRPVRKWVLHGVDYNILFDKLYLYNHDNPGLSLHKNAPYPQGTIDRDYLVSEMRNDSDIKLVLGGRINYQSLISEIGTINPDGPGIPVNPGASLRALFQDCSGIVLADQPGAVIWYINPDRRVVYAAQDTNIAPFSVSDNSSTDVGCRNLVLTTDISNLRNNVVLFANSLNPDPHASPPPYLLYRRNEMTASVGQYGLWQYSEQVPHWSQAWLNARSTKLLFQNGTPAQRGSWTMFRPGLYPGMIVTVASDAYGVVENLPVRSIDISFPTPHYAQIDVQASFDTLDPWGLLLALKRPPTRGFIQPTMQTVDLTRYPAGSTPPYVAPFTLVTEKPKALGGNRYQTTYAYIRYSMSVWVGGGHLDTSGGLSSDGSFVDGTYAEDDPDNGIFTLYTPPAGKSVVCTYHVASNLASEPV